MPAEIGRVRGGQPAAAAAHRGAHRVDDERLGHRASSAQPRPQAGLRTAGHGRTLARTRSTLPPAPRRARGSAAAARQWRADGPELHAGTGEAPPATAGLLRRADDAGRPRRAGQRRRLRHRRRVPGGRPAARPGRLARAELARGVRRARRGHAGPAHLHRRGGGGRGAGAVPHHQHGRPDHHAVRHAGAEGVLPAADRGRRDPLLDRVLRAGGRHRPGRAAHPRRPGRGGLPDQRAEDVDQPDPVRGLRVAGLPDRPGRAPAPRPVHPHRADRRARLLLDAGAHHGRPDHQRDLLLRRAGARLRPGRRGEPGLAADHQPAQPRAGRAHLGRAHPHRAARRAGLGRRRPSWPPASGSSTPSGCRSTWPGCTPRPSS